MNKNVFCKRVENSPKCYEHFQWNLLGNVGNFQQSKTAKYDLIGRRF